MIRSGFLCGDDRAALRALARDRSAAHRLARRANALVLLDAGWTCAKVAGGLLLDDDTIRTWHAMFLADGFEGLPAFEAGGSACLISAGQQAALKDRVAATLPRLERAMSGRGSKHNLICLVRAERG